MKPSDAEILKSCDTSVILNKPTIIENEDYDDWRVYEDNEYLICNPDTTGDDIYIDLNRMPNDDQYNSKKAAWLKKYGKYVDYYKSAPFIKRSHTFDPAKYDVNVISNITEVKMYDIADLPNMNRTDFDNDIYNNYLEVTVNMTDINNTTMSFQYINNFNDTLGRAYFSIPLLRSIIMDYDSGKDIFEFTIAKVEEISTNITYDRTVVRVKGFTVLYDMTTWPTK
ncbi:MAG: hypothetical protein DI539_16970 [Flavobacterium psychrophilum]|nr:MAG: hypothetical protein DI539_16970 [Flavobacterium psychrophilum]